MAINTWNEGALHAALKTWYAEPGDLVESPVAGSVIDLVRGDLLIEVQTGNMSQIKGKLARLLPDYCLRLVVPVASRRWIVRLDADHQISRRRSPLRGTWWHAFADLVYIPHLWPHPNLSLDLLLIEEEQIMRQIGRRAWRRRGWSIVERRLLRVVERRRFDAPGAFIDMLPAGLLTPFTTEDLASALQIKRALAQKIAYVLWRAGALERVGKAGRSYLYERAVTDG